MFHKINILKAYNIFEKIRFNIIWFNIELQSFIRLK